MFVTVPAAARGRVRHRTQRSVHARLRRAGIDANRLEAPTAMLQVKRTLVKSGPELWAEISDPVALARHLAPFGSVRITATTPETHVAWQGERAGGELALEPSGFGTKVILTALLAGEEPEPEPEPPPEPPAKRSFWARLFRRAPEPPEPAPPPAPPRERSLADDAALLVLTDTLDALGKAHHRPFSRI
jgi:hypothetical protein